MSLETITVYKDDYYNMMHREMDKSSELAYVQGTIKALAGMGDNPEFVMQSLKDMAEKIEKGVDISA